MIDYLLKVCDDKFVLHPKNHRDTMHAIQQIPFNQVLYNIYLYTSFVVFL